MKVIALLFSLSLLLSFNSSAQHNKNMKLNYVLTKNIDTVFSYLTNMEKYAAIHPVISKIDSLDNNHYLVHETLRICFIPISFTYPVTLKIDSTQNRIEMNAVVMKVNKVFMTFQISQNDKNTLVKEQITFKTLPGSSFILKKIFKKQHQLFFKNLEEL